ncbi:hypothetical protein LTR22_023521 [Elasticomyces elasticus]|nr:hypothetical protein LTR22_023521 [Elasticomyces elasticus]KAK4920668.1 hypothetical protein LTR49_011744 [Elasticomyces elasticus]KAK5746318.1 hypothetical protein LTS12_022751 [Elasticomyces elasticus]
MSARSLSKPQRLKHTTDLLTLSEILTTRLFRPVMVRATFAPLPTMQRQLSPLLIRPILATHPSSRLFYERSPAPGFGFRQAAARHRRFEASSGDVSRGMAMTPAKLAPEACRSTCDSVGNKEGHEQSENEASNTEILFNVLAIPLCLALFAIYFGYLILGVIWVLEGFPTSTPVNSRAVDAEQAGRMAEQEAGHLGWYVAQRLLNVQQLMADASPEQSSAYVEYELEKAKDSIEQTIAGFKRN